MNTQTPKATQELTDAQLEAISGGCRKRYDEEDCYEKRHCDGDYEDKKSCSDDYEYESSCNYDYQYDSCHEPRRRRHHGC